MFGICHLSVIPCRAEPSDKSEMVSQLLFGEYFQVLSQKGSWCQIKNAHDNYLSWIDIKQFKKISESRFKELSKQPIVSALDLVQIISDSSGQSVVPVLIGSSLPFYSNSEEELGFDDFKFRYDGQTSNSSTVNSAKVIVETALTYLNAPYLWGGRSPFGIDCSGLTQVSYKVAGIKINRDASQQAEQGYPLSFIEEAEPGDLAFFDNEEGRIIHVGILIGNNKIVHASGKVRIDKIDHQGIFNVDTKRYTHKLRLIKKII